MRAMPSEASRPGDWFARHRGLAPLLLIAIVLAVYRNSFSGAFLFDDLSDIVGNPNLRPGTPLGIMLRRAQRPVVDLTLFANRAIGGLDVFGYHAVNVAIHLLAALTLWALIRRTLRLPSLGRRWGSVSDGIAWAAAVLWAIHPLQTESVTYLIQRAESLAGLWYFLTLYGLVRAAESPRRRWAALAVASCALGMATKPVMATAPLAAMLFDRCLIAGSWRTVFAR